MYAFVSDTVKTGLHGFRQDKGAMLGSFASLQQCGHEKRSEKHQLGIKLRERTW